MDSSNSRHRRVCVMGIVRFTAAVLLPAVLFLPPVASAAPKDGQAFGSWQARCAKPEGASKEQCLIEQEVTDKDKKRVLLRMAVTLRPKDKEYFGLLTMPLGILLPTGVSFQVDKAEPKRIPVLRCMATGCVARFGLDQKLLASLKAGTQAKVTYLVGPKRPVSVNVSLNGFTAGVNALKQ